MATDVERISVEQAREILNAGRGAVLVCAYEDENKCERHGLQGILSLREFDSRGGLQDRDREIIFYCA